MFAIKEDGIPADPWSARLLPKIFFEKKEVTTVADF
jgi:hypothetical protein